MPRDMRTAVALGVAVMAAVVLVLPLLLFAALTSPSRQPCGVEPGDSGGDVAPAGQVAGLTEQQLRHAVTVITEGRRLGVPEQGIIVALATALQESRLRVYANDGRGGDLAPDQAGIGASLRLPHDAVGTDHGSLGVFQQQWPWWGTMHHLMDPATSADLFYDALRRVPGWQSMPVTAAAQSVQHSAFPDAYADDEPLARRLLLHLEGVTPSIAGASGTVGNAASSALSPASLGEDTHGGDTYGGDTYGGDTDGGDTDGGECVVLASARTVVYPLPAGSGYVDQRNFGGSGSHWTRTHTGTDLSVSCGTPVLAAHAGTVRIDTHQSWAGPWLVQVQTAPGALTTWYAHMQRVTVRDGEAVHARQVLGEVGELGNATGCHLHFEVHPHGGGTYEDPIDPSRWLATHVGRVVPGDAVRVASFNVLGASHTKPGGTRPTMAPGSRRIRWVLQILDANRIDIVGLQEFQQRQARVFRAAGGRTWSVYSPPGSPANSVAWRRGSWRLVRGYAIRVPYFHGNRQPMPLVLLRHRTSGQELWIFNVHNPATTRHHPGNEQWRDAATALELRTIRRLRTDSEVPALLTGDFNEHVEAYCRLTRARVLQAAPGNSTACAPPGWHGIDWIFATAPTRFTGWTVNRGPMVRRATDHPLVHADVTLTPASR